MGVLDKFLDAMKLNDDEEYDDEYLDDDFDDEEEEEIVEKPKRTLFAKKERPVVEEEPYDDEPVEPKKPVARPSAKVTPMRQPARKSKPQMEVCVLKPNAMEETREIIETLLGGSTVILNLEGMDLDVAQRIIDFISGAAFAMSGNLQRISSYIFLVTPAMVDISGDLQDLLGSSIDVNGRY